MRSLAEDCMATCERAEVIKGAFGRQSAVDMRMHRERAHTWLSSKWLTPMRWPRGRSKGWRR